MRVTLDINEQNSQAFMEFIRTLDYVSVISSDWYEALTEPQKQRIEQGLDDLKQGKSMSDEDVQSRIRKRIEERKNLEQ